MKTNTTIIAVVIVFGSGLLVHDYYRRAAFDEPTPNATSLEPTMSVSRSAPTHRVVRAAGHVEGSTKEIELRSRLSESITVLRVRRGDWVEAGATLVELESDQLQRERSVAQAMLDFAVATRQRLVNGSRASEVNIAFQEHESAAANLNGAEQAHQRALRLEQKDAISPQSLEEIATQLHSTRALAAAAHAKLEHLRLPAREDELAAADADVAAARSRLELAQINLERSHIKAPVAGQILSLNGEVGELVGPTQSLPLVVMVDTRRLRVLAEVDEFDAMRVRIGQHCDIHCDAITGVVGSGIISVIEPQMAPKKVSGQWAGERRDTFSRRVWIELSRHESLPVNLPVDVFIDVEE